MYDVSDKADLYDAFGEFIYAIAMADGEIQKEEEQKLHEILKGHEWAQEIEWSFHYEAERDHTVEFAYRKALDICLQHGPDPEYFFLLNTLEEIAAASSGISKEEAELLKRFRFELMEEFDSDEVDKGAA